MSVFDLWGKSCELNRTDSDHLLLWHVLDVAAVAGALWDEYASPAFRSRFTPGRAWFMLLAAAHDLGKVTPQFQNNPDAGPSARVPSGLPDLPGQGRSVAHELLGAVALRDWLVDAGAAAPAARDLAVAVSVLHGRFIPKVELDDAAPFLGRDTVPGLAWAARRAELMSVLVDVLGVGELPGMRRPELQVVHELAGLVKLADWVASAPDAFPYSTRMDEPAAYFADAVARAGRQVVRHGLVRFDVRPGLGFGDMFAGWTPSPMQSDVIRAAARADAPACIVVEDEMGRGKTEAALAAAYQLLASGRATGVYMAMPTQATSRSQHRRVSAWVSAVEATPGTPVTLNIGGSRDEPASFALRWASRAHRGLLPRVGVGTVDQVLLSAMPVRYGQTRVAGLAGRVVIFDEVHAYDSYQVSLLTGALRWLAFSGAHVIILSATLPVHLRGALLAAFSSGQSGGVDVEQSAPELSYPLVSSVVGTDPVPRYLTPAPGPSRSVDVVRVPHGDAASWMARLAGHVGSGARGTIGIICNSVASAIAVYDQVAAYFPDVETLLCLHARFTVHGRRVIEDAVMSRLGRGGIASRGRGLTIVVGTQVLEQSLDIDVDLLVTEMAPVDLLLQRSGRVQRFGSAVERPAWAPTPTMWVISPPVKDGLPELDAVAYVYSRTTPTALLGSWQVLDGLRSFTVPDDIPGLVREVYDDLALRPDRVRGDLLPLWSSMFAAESASVAAAELTAAQRLLPPPWLRRATHAGDAVDDELDFASRLGEETVEVVPVLPCSSAPGFVPVVDVHDGAAALPWSVTKVRGGWGDQVVRVRRAQVEHLLDTQWMPFVGYGTERPAPGDPGVAAWRRSPMRRARLLVVGAGSPAQYFRSKGLVIAPASQVL